MGDCGPKAVEKETMPIRGKKGRGGLWGKKKKTDSF